MNWDQQIMRTPQKYPGNNDWWRSDSRWVGTVHKDFLEPEIGRNTSNKLD